VVIADTERRTRLAASALRPPEQQHPRSIATLPVPRH
jgi:hypothetical protein